MGKNVAVIICAAGSSQRFGGKKNKCFADVCGRAAFLRSVELFSDRSDVKQVLLGINPDDEEIVNIRWAPNLQFFGTKIYLGGPQRYDTIANGLALVNDDIDMVAVHDAARCCLTPDMIDKVFNAAAKFQAAILASRVIPTLKRVQDGKVIETVERADLYEAQTPQVFSKELLIKAYKHLKTIDPAQNPIRDDAQLVESLGQSVHIVESDITNLKITHGSDIAIAEAIIKSRPKPEKRQMGAFDEAQW